MRTSSRRDNPAYEYAAAVTPAPDQSDDQSVVREAACMARTALRTIAESIEDPCDLRIALLRASGMSLSEIGHLTGVSKQAVHKRISKICRRSTAVACWLGMEGSDE